MPTHHKVLLISCLLAAFHVFGQPYEPMELAQKIFSTEKFPDIKKYCTGEYEGKPNGQDLENGTRTKFRLLGQTDSTAVVNIILLDTEGKGFDGYLHFEKNKIWQLAAFRALAMTGLIERGLMELEKMTLQQVDQIVAKSTNKDEDNAVFRSREDYYFQLGNARLTLALDDTLEKHFLDNRVAFELLKDLAIGQMDSIEVGKKGRQTMLMGQKEAYRKLFISFVYAYGSKSSIRIDFFIGGMIDNTVGYFYTNDKNNLPVMDDRRYIMIREISEGWYIYKTT